MTQQSSYNNQSYGQIVWRQFKKNRLALWSLRLLAVIALIGLLSDFIANDKPLLCKIDGAWHFPIFHQYAVDVGLAKWEARFVQNNWSDHEYQFKLMPIIPYSASFQDRKNRSFVSPFDEQRIESARYRHWLGTDLLGRDVLAGMIAGTRVAMLVGLIAMSIATLIGLFFGTLAGYFGDERFKISRARLIMTLLSLPIAIFYAFVVRSNILAVADESENLIAELGKSFFIFIGILLLFNLIAELLKKIPLLGKKITIPLDILVMRMIEIFNSIPGLLLLLAILAIIKKPTIIYVMVIIGFIRWTPIARFIRAELLKIRQLEYIHAAEAMGFGKFRIIFRHAIPNALTPVLIHIAFGIAGAILLEATLSFLGIGVAPEEVTWGSLLSAARQNFSAWWLAIFPGFAIFVTVTIFNLIGDGLTDAVDPRLTANG